MVVPNFPPTDLSRTLISRKEYSKRETSPQKPMDIADLGSCKGTDHIRFIWQEKIKRSKESFLLVLIGLRPLKLLNDLWNVKGLHSRRQTSNQWSFQNQKGYAPWIPILSLKNELKRLHADWGLKQLAKFDSKLPYDWCNEVSSQTKVQALYEFHRGNNEAKDDREFELERALYYYVHPSIDLDPLMADTVKRNVRLT